MANTGMKAIIALTLIELTVYYSSICAFAINIAYYLINQKENNKDFFSNTELILLGVKALASCSKVLIYAIEHYCYTENEKDTKIQYEQFVLSKNLIFPIAFFVALPIVIYSCLRYLRPSLPRLDNKTICNTIDSCEIVTSFALIYHFSSKTEEPELVIEDSTKNEVEQSLIRNYQLVVTPETPEKGNSGSSAPDRK